MNKWLFLWAFLGFGLLAMPVHAQMVKPPDEPERPFFVGIHFLQSSYEVFFPSSPEGNLTGVTPWQLSAGGNLSPRLALQLGYSYRHEEDHLDPSYTGTTLSGQFISGSSSDERWTHCVPLLARYTALGFPNHRLQADLLLGLTLLHTREFSAVESRVDYQVVSKRSDQYKATQGYISGGFGLHYSFSYHFEGILDCTYSHNFHPASEDVHLNVTGNRFGLTRALSLGLRYRFAVKKKAAAASGS